MAPRDRDPITQTVPKESMCKACSRTLATTSPDGELVPAGTQEQACDACSSFEELYECLKTKDEAFQQLKNRRFEHGGRLIALEEAKAAHKAFDNFLIQTEAQSVHSTISQTSNQPHAPLQNQVPASIETHQRGQKRTLTPSTPPKAKRPRLDQSARRVSFDSSIVFHDETNARPYQVFNRESKEYVPGRNAPPEPSGYLNTSGYGVAPLRFFGVRKHKRGWIETKEGKEMDESWTKETEAEDPGDAVKDGAAGCVEASGEVHFTSGDTRRESPAMANADRKVEKLNSELSSRAANGEDRAAATEFHRTTCEMETAGMGKPQPQNPVPDQFECKISTPVASMDKQVTEPSSTNEDEPNWTYGFGWNKKLSPNSRPRGEQWRPGLELESLPQHMKLDMLRRGRGYPAGLKNRTTLP
jgi:hypothetical protein